MRFFIPLKRVEFEYFEAVDSERTEANADDEAWAWAAARFGWTPEQWQALTPAQRMLLRKEDERRTVEVATLLRDVVGNALVNAFRRQGAKEVPLFRKTKRAAVDTARARAIFDRMEGINERVHAIG